MVVRAMLGSLLLFACMQAQAGLSIEEIQAIEMSLAEALERSEVGAFEDAATILDGLSEHMAELPEAVQANFWSARGIVAASNATAAEALQAFERAMALSARDQLSEVWLSAALNAARAQIDDGQLAGLETRLEALNDHLRSGGATAQRWLTYGELARRTVAELAFPVSWRTRSLQAFEQAAEISPNDPEVLGWSYGLRGQLYEEANRLEEATALTRLAMFHAQQAQLDDQLYRWEWQIARLARSRGDLSTASAAIERSVTMLDRVKARFVRGDSFTFERQVAPVYRLYADINLQLATAKPTVERQQMLHSVRERLETLKQAEIEDYFAQECLVREDEIDAATSSQIRQGVAIIYPVFLDARLEVLTEIEGTFHTTQVAVPRNLANRIIRRFRVNLERVGAGGRHLRQAQQIYDWLIRPLEDVLREAGVTTLVIVPEGALRSVPLAALNDGDRYLVERYAVASTPAIRLTRSHQEVPIDQLLLGGITDSVQGFSELPSVARELTSVASRIPAEPLKNEAFELQRVASKLSDSTYSIAHFATHGEFNRDYRKSFILTYDDKLTLNDLQSVMSNRSSDPLDLLVLSACRTAAGDERAALGLAGIAVQSGARSALASLWYISDSATATLVDRFYAAITKPGTSKAAGLREAQLSLLAEQQYRHPAFWAPFLLIGNWI